MHPNSLANVGDSLKYMDECCHLLAFGCHHGHCSSSGKLSKHEPEFLNTLKCNLAESVSTGFQFNCYDIFNVKYHFFRSVKFTENNLFYHK